VCLFLRILIPIDLTDKNRSALTLARELAEHSGSTIRLLHVIERIEHISAASLRSFYRRLERVAESKMRSLAKEFFDESPLLQVLYGRTTETIVKFAVKHRVDLIVLSSHRVDTRHPERGWATTSHKVAILAQCPVLLVK